MRTLFIFCLVLSACANPKYVTNDGGGAATTTATETAYDLKPGTGRLSLKWETPVTTEEYGTFLLKIGRANLGDGSLLLTDPAGTLNVFLWMPDMTPPHGSSPVVVERVDVGTFRVSHVFFIMAGAWEIHVQVKDGDAVRSEAVIPFRL